MSLLCEECDHLCGQHERIDVTGMTWSGDYPPPGISGGFRLCPVPGCLCLTLWSAWNATLTLGSGEAVFSMPNADELARLRQRVWAAETSGFDADW